MEGTAVEERQGLQYLRELVLSQSGIVLDADKDYLLHSRLEPLARELEFSSVEELADHLCCSKVGTLHGRVVEAMTTNETSFFRDVHPFEVFRDHVLPDLIAKRQHTKTLSLWCGASSSGQEPFTVAMIIREHFPDLSTWPISFLATDISEEMLRKCREGSYSQLEVNRGVPTSFLLKFFEKKGMSWRIKEELQSMIDFQRLNLIGPWPPIGPVDVVWLRNVLIYFDVDKKKEILQKIKALLRPDGYLFLGGAETTMNLDDCFERLPYKGTSCYRVVEPWKG